MSNKDFATIKENAGNVLGDTSSSFSTKLGVYANNRYSDIVERLKGHNLFESFVSMTATTTANVRDYSLRSDLDDIVYAKDDTNGRVLDVINEEEWVQRFGTAPNTTGSPIVLVRKGTSTVRTQPSTTSTLRAVSTSTSDTTQYVKFRAISGSAEFYDTITLNGTTSAACTASYDYYIQIMLDSTCAGKVTCTFVTGSEVATIISQGQTENRYKRIGFHYVPAGTYDIDIRGTRKVSPLINADDTPLIDIADGIEIGTIADGWRAKRQYGWAADHETLYERWLDRYINQRITGMTHQFDITPENRSASY